MSATRSRRKEVSTHNLFTDVAKTFESRLDKEWVRVGSGDIVQKGFNEV